MTLDIMHFMGPAVFGVEMVVFGEGCNVKERNFIGF